MRIVRITVDRCELPLDPPFVASWDPVPRTVAPATVVRVETDDGAIGVGGGDTLHGVESYLPLLIGADPRRIEAQVRVLETIDLLAGRPWPLEVALWDLMGQVYGQPVWHLFGGVSDRLAAYASLGARRDAEAMVETVCAVHDDGFAACKLRLDAHRLDNTIATAQAVRAAVGPGLALMVDLNQAWRMAGDTTSSIDVAVARRIADALAELDVTWLEEPLAAGDHTGLAALRAAGSVRIAGGELTRTFDELLDAVVTDRYDVHQPDVVLSGMWRGRTIAELALRRGRWYTPHTWTDGIGLLANLHVCAGVGGGPYLEYPYDPDGWTPNRRDFLLRAPVEVTDGLLVVGEQPGLGIAIDEDAVTRTRIERIVASGRGVERRS
ncbi:MAG: mandelate racemase/muconate lactonizing enzyme family protein [Actinobacteria bacterium]|nr:mandelate racemase/muconate lactonizing enzyme family protein [Actinomycetota bacterium]